MDPLHILLYRKRYQRLLLSIVAWTAVTCSDLDLHAGTVEIRAPVVRVKDQGLVRKGTETPSGASTLLPPA
jgi:hypothetical protein